jgi:methionine sulfoxide reductase catalytic subunit
MSSGQAYPESDISPYHWVNGAPPTEKESPEYGRMREDGFQDWRLEVGGLVRHPLSLSLDDIRALPSQVQITKHNCVQGWCGVAKWKGVRVSEILKLAEPLPEAKYLKFTSGLAQYSYGGKPLEPPYGAPLRLRVETQLGYKMVKYLRSIELIADYRTVGEGQGGLREDAQFFGRGAEI